MTVSKGNLPTTCNSSADLVSFDHVQGQPSLHRWSSKRNWGKENKHEEALSGGVEIWESDLTWKEETLNMGTDTDNKGIPSNIKPHHAHSSRNDKVGGYLCHCPRNLTESSGQTHIDECEGDPCQNGAACLGICNLESYPCFILAVMENSTRISGPAPSKKSLMSLSSQTKRRSMSGHSDLEQILLMEWCPSDRV